LIIANENDQLIKMTNSHGHYFIDSGNYSRVGVISANLKLTTQKVWIKALYFYGPAPIIKWNANQYVTPNERIKRKCFNPSECSDQGFLSYLHFDSQWFIAKADYSVKAIKHVYLLE